MGWQTGETLAAFDAGRPHSPAAVELGRAFLAIDPENRRIKLAFDIRSELTNPTGGVQGGIQIAMLDEAMTEAAVLATDSAFYVPTLSVQARYLRAAPAGRLIVIAWVQRLGQRTAFLEAELYDTSETELLTTASATVALSKPGRRDKKSG